MVGYMIVAYLCRQFLHEPESQKSFVTILFDAATFAGSFMLLWGIWDSKILVLLGNTKFFLVVAGLAGVIYSLTTLVASGRRLRF